MAMALGILLGGFCLWSLQHPVIYATAFLNKRPAEWFSSIHSGLAQGIFFTQRMESEETPLKAKAGPSCEGRRALRQQMGSESWARLMKG